jgi:hypothetical protein
MGNDSWPDGLQDHPPQARSQRPAPRVRRRINALADKLEPPAPAPATAGAATPCKRGPSAPPLVPADQRGLPSTCHELTDWGDGKRLLASVWVWLRITGAAQALGPARLARHTGRRGSPASPGCQGGPRLECAHNRRGSADAGGRRGQVADRPIGAGEEAARGQGAPAHRALHPLVGVHTARRAAAIACS